MTILLNIPITTAVTASVTTPDQFREGNPESAIIQGTFTYGSGGTTANVWVQTSVDEGSTWNDVANFSFATTTARAIFNVSALTVITTQLTTASALKDGALAANTAQDGILGPLWRCKMTTVGTYVATSIRVDVAARGRATT